MLASAQLLLCHLPDSHSVRMLTHLEMLIVELRDRLLRLLDAHEAKGLVRVRAAPMLPRLQLEVHALSSVTLRRAVLLRSSLWPSVRVADCHHHEIFADRLGLGHFDLLRRLVAHRHNDLLERALRLPLPANKLAVALLLVDCSQ